MEILIFFLVFTIGLSNAQDYPTLTASGDYPTLTASGNYPTLTSGDYPSLVAAPNFTFTSSNMPTFGSPSNDYITGNSGPSYTFTSSQSGSPSSNFTMNWLNMLLAGMMPSQMFTNGQMGGQGQGNFPFGQTNNQGMYNNNGGYGGYSRNPYAHYGFGNFAVGNYRQNQGRGNGRYNNRGNGRGNNRGNNIQNFDNYGWGSSNNNNQRRNNGMQYGNGGFQGSGYMTSGIPFYWYFG